jgi:26S proteasome regulatory subunit N10
MRIVAFVGSPVETEEKELVKLAKRLKKEKVNIDIVSFGEEVSPGAHTTLVHTGCSCSIGLMV